MEQISAHKIVLHKIKFKVESIISNKGGYFIIIKDNSNRTPWNFTHLKNIGSEYKTQKLTELPKELDNSITWDFNTFIPITDK